MASDAHEILADLPGRIGAIEAAIGAEALAIGRKIHDAIMAGLPPPKDPRFDAKLVDERPGEGVGDKPVA